MTIMSFVIPEAGAKHKLLFNKPASGFIEHLSLTYEAQQSVTKIIPVTIMNLVTPKAGDKCEPWFNKLAAVASAEVITVAKFYIINGPSYILCAFEK
jgi:hypothetical protein